MKKEMAVFTIVQNDPWMASRWLKYYGQYFDKSDIYVMDHLLKKKPCTDALKGKCKIHHLYHDFTFDHNWLRETVCRKQEELLQKYDKVLFTEIDEFVVPDPDHYADLTEYIRKFDGPMARVSGRNVMHSEGEPPLDLNADLILPQRSQWRMCESFDKPLLATIPLSYNKGFHLAEGFGREFIDPDLVMVHLKWACYDYLLERNRDICARNWPLFDWKANLGCEHKMLHKEEVDKFIAEWMAEATPIPERFKKFL